MNLNSEATSGGHSMKFNKYEEEVLNVLCSEGSSVEPDVFVKEYGIGLSSLMRGVEGLAKKGLVDPAVVPDLDQERENAKGYPWYQIDLTTQGMLLCQTNQFLVDKDKE